VPTITAFVAAFDAKALNCAELLESYLAGENRIINCHRQTNRNRQNWNIWHSTWSTLFIRITSVFSYLYCKKTNTLHLCSMRGGTKTLKHNVRTTLQLSYHGCKYLTHTSKTPHVKRTQMVVIDRFMIRVTSLPKWNKQGIKICDWFLAYYTCGVQLLEYRYAQVWNIAKRRKQRQSADFSKAYRKPSRAFNCSLFACFLLFQTGKNRMQLNYCVKRCGGKIRTVARKSWIGGLKFRKGTWHSESLIKSLLICSVSYLNLEGLSSPMITVATGLV